MKKLISLALMVCLCLSLGVAALPRKAAPMY